MRWAQVASYRHLSLSCQQNQGLFLSVYVDDKKRFGRAEPQSYAEEIDEIGGSGRTDIISSPRALGMHPT